MDSYDIFRQLTRGAKFRKIDRSQAENSKVITKEENVSVPIQEELFKENNNGFLQAECDIQINETYKFELVSEVSDTIDEQKRKIKQRNTLKLALSVEKNELETLRKKNKITVFGRNIPPPITKFDELQKIYNLRDNLVNNLMDCNYAEPTPIQMQAMPIMLKGRSVLACAPTGSGKTIAFLIPILHDLGGPKKVGFRALVLAPTRELAQQIYRECVRLSVKTGLKIHFINKVQQAHQKFGIQSSKRFDILISTPNRIRYLLQLSPPLLDFKSIQWIILDEADRLMEDGPDNFKPQIDDILAACTNPNRRLALFSATYTVSVAKWALRNIKKLARVNIGLQNALTIPVEQELLFVGSESGKLLAIRDLIRNGIKPPVLIFVESKDRAKQLFEELLYDGINVDVIHSDRTKQQRDNCVRAFREGNIWVLICTELMGRGIDFKGINLVLNYDFPPSVIAYIHRIGRTGRAGRPGKAITFFTHNDTAQLRRIAEIVKTSGGKVPEFMLNLKKIVKSQKQKKTYSATKRDPISTKIVTKIKTERKYQKDKKRI